MTPRPPGRTVVSVSGRTAGVAIACDSGAAWVTQCCDATDYVLTAGADFATRTKGTIVVQLLTGGRISIRIGDAPPGGRPRGRRSEKAQSWRASIRRWGRRLCPEPGR